MFSATGWSHQLLIVQALLLLYKTELLLLTTTGSIRKEKIINREESY